MSTIMPDTTTSNTSSAKVTGEVMRAMRDGVGMTIRGMASSVGCSHQHLARIESGQRALTPDLAAKVAQAIADHLNRRAA
jgi:plasmid maintenance system antidote protein VapI